MTKIVSLVAENFKRLRAVEINPDDHTVVISGRNAQGKSSVLDAIQAALAGKRGVKELTEPIRQGESKARVVLELDDLRIERKWTPSGSQLVVSPRDGAAKFNSPQAILDKLIGALSFDPLEFANADPKTQVEQLIDAVGAREQLDVLAADRREAYETRTDANREVKRYQAEVDSRSDAREVEPVDPSKLSTELEGAIELERARDEWQRIEDRIVELRAQQAKLTEAAQAVKEHVNPRYSEEIRVELRHATEINKAAQRWIDLNAAREYLDDAQRRSEALTSRIRHIDEAKDKLVASLDLPVDGLTFDEDGILLNSVPFVQASAAERLKVSVAMAMSMNPDLRVICIRDASLLDDESFAAIQAMAAERDYQVWYEVVGDRGDIGVVIEDGAVQA